MLTLRKQWQISAVVVVCVCAFMAVGCRSLTGRSFGQQWDDKTITSQVKTKLITESFHNTFATDVGTHYGVVYLGGTAHTPEARAEAERIASRVKGVQRVVNNIVIVPREGKMAGQPLPSSPAASPGTSGSTR